MSSTIGERFATPRTRCVVGAARRDITPPIGIRARNWGPATWNRAEGVHRPFVVTALAVGDDDGGVVLLLAADGSWWRRVDDEWSVRGEILARLGLEPHQLMFSLSHTHAGAVLCTHDAALDGGELIGDYLQAIVEASVAAGREALESMGPGAIEWGYGRSALAANRELDVSGRAVVGLNPTEPADDTVVVGRVIDASGSTVATLVNYACHPTTLAWECRDLSPDYVGAMREVVERETGAPCMFMQGASGELAPREQYAGDTDVADRHGRALGHAVLSALANMTAPGTDLGLTAIVESGAPLAMWTPIAPSDDAVTGRAASIDARRSTVRLELRVLPTLAELELEWQDIDPLARQERLARARNLRDGYIQGPTVEHPVWVWRLGEAFIVAHPGEAYSWLQVRLRARFPGVPIVVANLTNGPGFVYLPTPEAYARGTYQAWQTPLAAGSLERLEHHAARQLQVMLRDD